jgi:hypothetical protein
MIISVRHSIVIFALWLAWTGFGGLQLIAYCATSAQSTFQGEEPGDFNQEAIAESAHGQKRDTVRRDHIMPNSLGIYSQIRLLTVRTRVKPNKQTDTGAASRPLHQKISLYLI